VPGTKNLGNVGEFANGYARVIMKLFEMLAVAFVAATISTMSAQAGAQTLTAATVQLHTNDDDRPADATLGISVSTGKGVALFSDGAPAEAYEPNSDHTIILNVPEGIDKKQFVKSFAMIHFQPKGRDALKFDFTVELLFSDNSKVVGSWKKLFLDQDHMDFTGALYLP
jgi:hypothetical protein